MNRHTSPLYIGYQLFNYSKLANLSRVTDLPTYKPILAKEVYLWTSSDSTKNYHFKTYTLGNLGDPDPPIMDPHIQHHIIIVNIALLASWTLNQPINFSLTTNRLNSNCWNMVQCLVQQRFSNFFYIKTYELILHRHV